MISWWHQINLKEVCLFSQYETKKKAKTVTHNSFLSASGFLMTVKLWWLKRLEEEVLCDYIHIQSVKWLCKIKYNNKDISSGNVLCLLSLQHYMDTRLNRLHTYRMLCFDHTYFLSHAKSLIRFIICLTTSYISTYLRTSTQFPHTAIKTLHKPQR